MRKIPPVGRLMPEYIDPFYNMRAPLSMYIPYIFTSSPLYPKNASPQAGFCSIFYNLFVFPGFGAKSVCRTNIGGNTAAFPQLPAFIIAEKDHPGEQGYVLHEGDLRVKGEVMYLPYYMAAIL